MKSSVALQRFEPAGAIFARLDAERGWSCYQRSRPLSDELERERAFVAIDMVGSSPLGAGFESALGHVRSLVEPRLFHVFMVWLQREPSQPSRYVVTLEEADYATLGFHPYVLQEHGGFSFGAEFAMEPRLACCCVPTWSVPAAAAKPSLDGAADGVQVVSAIEYRSDHSPRNERVFRQRVDGLTPGQRSKCVLVSFGFGRAELYARFGPVFGSLCERAHRPAPRPGFPLGPYVPGEPDAIASAGTVSTKPRSQARSRAEWRAVGQADLRSRSPGASLAADAEWERIAIGQESIAARIAVLESLQRAWVFRSLVWFGYGFVAAALMLIVATTVLLLLYRK